MNSMTRIRSALLAAVLAGPAFAPQAAAADDIKVGILLPLSGPIAPIGQNNRRGHVLAIEDINAAGGIKSLGGAKLVIVDGDTQGNPRVGIQEAEKLARQGVVAILGAYQSNVTFPSTQTAEKLGVPPAACLVIEDSPAGVDAARAAGMRVLALTTTHERSSLERADAVFDAFAAIPLESWLGALT